MNIQIISQFYHPDNFRINDIAAELAFREHHVRVLTGLPDYALSRIPREYRFFRRRKEIVDGVFIRRVPIIARHKGMLFRLLNYVSFVVSGSLYALFTRKTDFDLLFVNETSPIFQAIPAILWKRRKKKRLVLYCYDLWPESMKAWNVGEDHFIYRMVKQISGWIYCSCDLVAITSAPFREYLMEVCGVASEQIVYLPQYAEDSYSDIAGVYEDNNCIDFLFAGNLGAVQNVDCILRATALVQTNNAFCIHIVGDGSELENLKTLALELLLEKRVHFHGRYPLAAMKRFYRMADCLLLTLRGGDFIGMTLPGKAQGYLSAGKPVLAAINGAGREMVEAANCGEVVPAGDYVAMAERMQAMVENFEPYKEKGLNGRLYYEQHYTRDTFMASLEKILEEQSNG